MKNGAKFKTTCKKYVSTWLLLGFSVQLQSNSDDVGPFVVFAAQSLSPSHADMTHTTRLSLVSRHANITGVDRVETGVNLNRTDSESFSRAHALWWQR